MTTIKSILEELLGHDDGVEIGSGYHDECKQEIDQALQQIEQLIEEVVGKIEQPYTSENPWEEDSRHARNRLRTEQRANLKKVIR